MKSSTKSKTILETLNAHMVVALLSVFIAAIALICIGFIFGVNLITIGDLANAFIDFYQWVAISIIIVGLALIILGVFQSIGLIKRIKQVFDVILSGKSIGVEGDGAFETQTQTSAGGARGLNIIRPPLRESQPEPTPAKQPATRAPSPQRQEAKISKPAPTKVSTSQSEKDEKPKEEGVDISLEEALQKIVDRYNDPSVAKKFSSWDETLMMTFPDLDKSYLYKIHRDEGIDLVEGYNEEAAVQVKLSSDIFIKMMTNQINPIKAYSSGELEVSGKMRNLLKLRKLMF